MGKCDVCGNEYAMAFHVQTYKGRGYTFDSLECAATAIAPTCAHCGCRVLGHGVQGKENQVYCCAHCATQDGAQGVSDNAVT